MLPDFYRPSIDGTDKLMFQLDSLSRNPNLPPTPLPPSPNTRYLSKHISYLFFFFRFWGVKGFVDLPWDTEYKTNDDVRWGLVIRRELEYTAEHGIATFNDFMVSFLRLTYFNLFSVFSTAFTHS